MPPQTRITDRARAAVAQRTETAPVQAGGVTLKQRIANMEQAFALAMPRGAEAKQLVRDALTCLARTPKLEECEASTVLGALMTCAQLGLRPGVLGHAWLLPMKNRRKGITEATLVIGYQGYAELAHRTGLVQSLIARPVYQNDTFSVDYGLADSLVHKPELFGDRGPVIAYYSIIKYTTGGHAFLVMSKSDIEKHRDRFAMARDRDRNVIGPWVDHFDSMALKTVYLQLQKWAPKSTDLGRALAADGAVRDDVDPGALDVMPPSYDLEGEVVSDTADPPAEPIQPAGDGIDGSSVNAEPVPPGQAAVRAMFAELRKVGGLDGDASREERLAFYSGAVGRRIDSTDDLSAADVATVTDLAKQAAALDGEARQDMVGGLVVEGHKMRSDAPA